MYTVGYPIVSSTVPAYLNENTTVSDVWLDVFGIEGCSPPTEQEHHGVRLGVIGRGEVRMGLARSHVNVYICWLYNILPLSHVSASFPQHPISPIPLILRPLSRGTT